MKSTSCKSQFWTFTDLFIIMVLFFCVFSAGCATVGREFNVSQVPNIQIGKTSQDDIKEMFGSPWRTGIEDGKRTWTYGRYLYSLFEEASTQDLVVRFNDKGIVTSYTYNATQPQE
ncbi:MAG: outer membrane protein assembly factor BamE [Elusimicrobia bacterium]|nr:outer membrane protein assembly factor BamE [Candidatus Liberimonas magnetica]